MSVYLIDIHRFVNDFFFSFSTQFRTVNDVDRCKRWIKFLLHYFRSVKQSGSKTIDATKTYQSSF